MKVSNLTFFNAVKIVIQENKKNWRTTMRLAIFESKAQHKGTVLGFLWSFIHPATQIFVFWLVFSIGLRGGGPIHGFPFLVWLMVGMMPWLFISSLLSGTSQCFRKSKSLISSMSMPLAIIPVQSVLVQLITHFWTMLVLSALLVIYGIRFNFTVIFLLYYAFATVAFFIGYAFVTSTISVLFLDFNKFLSSVIRLIFFISPIAWSFENLSPQQAQILRLNPITYIIEGYRHSMLYGNTPMAHWRFGIYFWVLTLVMFLLGCWMHCRLRRKFMDLL